MYVFGKLAEWLKECKLEINPEKTKIIYCKDANRKGKHEHTSFDFLEYTFRTRLSRKRTGVYFVCFSPCGKQKGM